MGATAPTCWLRETGVDPAEKCNWISGYQMDLKWTLRSFHLVMREHNAHEKGPQGYFAQAQSWHCCIRQTSATWKSQLSSHHLERVVFSAQCLALAKARHKMVPSLPAIKTSLALFPGMEELMPILLHAASSQITVATGKLPLGTLHPLC